MPSTYRALNNSNFRIYFITQFFSMSGTWMQSIAQGWLVYQITHSGYWLGIISFISQVPAFFISPLAGVIADQKDRRRILLVVQIICMAQAFLLAFLALSERIELWHILVLAALLSITNAFDMVGRHAFAADLVARQDLKSAINMNALVIQTSRILGPVVAGMLISLSIPSVSSKPLHYGEGLCFLVNALSYIPVIYGLSILDMPIRKLILHDLDTTIFKKFFVTLQYVSKTPVILKALGLATFKSFVCVTYVVLLPIFAKEVLHGDGSTLAWLSAFNGIGAVLGTLSIDSYFSTGSLRIKLTYNLIFIGLSLIFLGLAQNTFFIFVAVLLCGFFSMRAFPLLNHTIQDAVDERFRGRLASLYLMTFLGATPIGNLLAGFFSDRMGAPSVTMFCGAISIFVASLLLIPLKNPVTLQIK